MKKKHKGLQYFQQSKEGGRRREIIELWVSHCLWAPESKSDAHRITEALSDKINNYYGNKCPYFLAILFSEGLFCSKLYAHARAHTHTHTHTYIYTHIHTYTDN